MFAQRFVALGARLGPCARGLTTKSNVKAATSTWKSTRTVKTPVRKTVSPSSTVAAKGTSSPSTASASGQSSAAADEVPPPPTAASPSQPTVGPRSSSASSAKSAAAEIWKTFDDSPDETVPEGAASSENWATSFSGLGTASFSREVIDILLDATPLEDIEITPDGLLYLPEIRYRRVLNKAFGPGGWGLAPRSQTVVTPKTVSREYGLICQGRLVGVARGEQQYFDPDGVPTAIEGCKSNAMMRCCKDLGIASELWDPRFIRKFKKEHCESKWFEKKRRFVWKRKDAPWEYPYN